MSKRKFDNDLKSSQRKRKNEPGDVIDLCESPSHAHNGGDDGSDIVVVDETKSKSRTVAANASSTSANTENTSSTSALASASASASASKLMSLSASSSSAVASAALSTANTEITKNKKSKFKIFCDLDGVLVDFERGVRELFKQQQLQISSIPPRVLWSKIGSNRNFFRHLSWTVDGEELWRTLLIYHSGRLSVLTGCPTDSWSKFHKFAWCEQYLDMNLNDNHNSSVNISNSSSSSSSSSGNDDTKLKFVHVDKAAKKSKHELVIHHQRSGSGSGGGGRDNARIMGMKSISSMFQAQTNSKLASLSSLSTAKKTAKQNHMQNRTIDVITCWSKNKHYESRKNHVLIDDRIKLREDWVRKGGIFIHHTNTKDTIRQLVRRGIINVLP